MRGLSSRPPTRSGRTCRPLGPGGFEEFGDFVPIEGLPLEQGQRQDLDILPMRTKVLLRAGVRLAEDPPDYLVILAWNFAREIIDSTADYNGEYIIPIPAFKLV